MPPPLVAFAVLGALAAGPSTVALTGASVFDGTGRAPLRDAVILIRDGKIAALGPRAEVGLPADAQVVDLAGKWVIPGLVDAHVHFFQSSGLYTRPDVIDLRSVRPYEEERKRIRERLPATFARYLACGVTAVLDTGGPWWNFRLRKEARETLAAPRVAVAGPLLSPLVPPELDVEDPPIVRIRTPEEARAEVRRQLRERPDVVKLWLVRWSKSEPAWVRAAIEEAHAAGVRVAVHATELEIARQAVTTGADILAHSVRDRLVDASFLELLRARGTVYIPTLSVDENYRKVLTRTMRLSPFEEKTGDPEAIASWRDLTRFPAEARRASAGWPDAFPVEAENLRRVSAAGVTVAAGSDAGNIGTLHGAGLHRELERMVDAGLSPGEVLLAATRGGSVAVGRPDELGTLQPGKLADLVVLHADPLADIRNTRKIDRVLKGGVPLDPAALLRGER